jgi:hypothetical protein
MVATFPFLTSYDPPGTSEGTLDPLGLYQIADQLAVRLVPAVRERMQRIRFLTAMAVGSLVTENLHDNPLHRDASPYLVWEWLVVEALMRSRGDDPAIWGIPGSLVARRALDQHGYLDARSYLKTPRIFGFHGVYKRLAIHLRFVDVHLGSGPNAEGLADVWARGMGLRGLSEARPLIARWSAAVKRSLSEKPPHSKPNWVNENWTELAIAFAPDMCRVQEKRYLRSLLLAESDRRLGALPTIWQLISDSKDGALPEENLHEQLEKREPAYAALLHAIRTYERFARALQDGFDLIRAEATKLDAQGFDASAIGKNSSFKQSVKDLHRRFEDAHYALGDAMITSTSLQNLFDERFRAFAEPMDPGTCGIALCSHHETVQRSKSAEGKRPWFDRLGQNRIYIRHAYRQQKRDIQPEHYLHDYRSVPIRRFYTDIS